MFKKWTNLPHKDVSSCGHVVSSHYLSVDYNTGAYSMICKLIQISDLVAIFFVGSLFLWVINPETCFE
jgi:hypothetical protein